MAHVWWWTRSVPGPRVSARRGRGADGALPCARRLQVQHGRASRRDCGAPVLGARRRGAAAGDRERRPVFSEMCLVERHTATTALPRKRRRAQSRSSSDFVRVAILEVQTAAPLNFAAPRESLWWGGESARSLARSLDTCAHLSQARRAAFDFGRPRVLERCASLAGSRAAGPCLCERRGPRGPGLVGSVRLPRRRVGAKAPRSGRAQVVSNLTPTVSL